MLMFRWKREDRDPKIFAMVIRAWDRLDRGQRHRERQRELTELGYLDLGGEA